MFIYIFVVFGCRAFGNNYIGKWLTKRIDILWVKMVWSHIWRNIFYFFFANEALAIDYGHIWFMVCMHKFRTYKTSAKRKMYHY